jgi:F0F1-type ATP synthase assembly protein I
MSQTVPDAHKQSNRVFNTTLTAVVAQVGCFTPAIILAALFLGLWLDRTFDSKPLFTIVFIVGSMPISIIVLFAVVRSATKRLKSDSKQNSEIPSEGGKYSG